jgi:hypothetical protein
MRPDPGVALQEAIIARMDGQARGAERLRLAARGRLLAWQQVDALAPQSEIERAELLLRRLHPSLPEAALQQILGQLAAAEAAGEWHGFRRPEPLPIR